MFVKLKSALLPRLLVGMLIIPISYWVYTYFSIPRFQCHIPSWSIDNGHFIFEIVPILFVGASYGILFSTAQYALRHSEDTITNFATLALAFEFSVFTFALGYYQYGLISEPNEISLILTYFDHFAEALRAVPNPTNALNEALEQRPSFLGDYEVSESDTGLIGVDQLLSRSPLEYAIFSLSVGLWG